VLIKKTPSWQIPERMATPESVFLNRRKLLKASGIIAAGTAISGLSACGEGSESAQSNGAAQAAEAEDPSASLYPVPRNEKYTIERPLTDEAISSKYNNFYEFGSQKTISANAQNLRIRPWDVVIDGLVEEPITIAIDDLLAKMPLEERLYRLRCVEAWSMTIPWSGFPMRSLVELAKPLSGAKYVRMETFLDPDMASGQKQFWYPWPYVEGLTIEEATNDLAFLVTGAYGKPAAKQFGAPLRLAVPWKYGFKSIKSIVRFEFTAERPTTFWMKSGPTEYGFWANVNPTVDHPRWSQATEEVLGTGQRIPTQLYNGYAEQVAGLYKDLVNESLFM